MHSDLKTLEFDGIRRILVRLTLTPYGGDAAQHLEPAPDRAVAHSMQQSVTAARQLVDAGLLPRLGDVADIRAALRQADQVGAALSANALHNIRALTRTAVMLHQLTAGFPALCGQAERLLAPPALMQAIDLAINTQGRLRDDATPALQVLHSQYNALQQDVDRQLKAMMAAPEHKGLFDGSHALQWHGMRGVLAVKAASADRIKGVRHGSSAGGREMLIEPIALVGLNNKLEAINGQIEAQNQELLRALTELLRTHLPALQAMVDALAWVDLALAGGQLSAALNATPPELMDSPLVMLDRAYHPQLLLQFQQRQIEHLVPLTLALTEQQPMLVITGPNTGGKTVVLKTVGLLVTMAYCGLHLPSEGTCRIGDFTRVIVDVGDRQSLHHHLSTFAGHVEVLKRLLEQADEHTLVLMDELGTGTDPEEGASLAMAVLDELASRKVLGIVTTHLTPLKTFADTHPYLGNASMRFDYATLSPTYQLEPGHAGQSLGLIIAEKNGLSGELVAVARGYLERIKQGGF